MDLGQDELLSRLRGIDEYEFEKFVADAWEEDGWETTVTSRSNDRGVDVTAEESSPVRQKLLIQAKRYAAGSKIGRPDIQQYSSLQHSNDRNLVVVLTTSSFTSNAEEEAEKLGVELINAEDLYQFISKLDNPQSLLSEYIKMGSQSTDSESPTESTSHTSISSGPSADSESPTESVFDASLIPEPPTAPEIEFIGPNDKELKLKDNLPDNMSVEKFCSDLIETADYYFVQQYTRRLISFTSKRIYYITGRGNSARYKKISYNYLYNTKAELINKNKPLTKLTLGLDSGARSSHRREIVVKATKSRSEMAKIKNYVREKKDYI